MRQYQVTYETMIDENKKLFDEFFRIHEEYIKNPNIVQEKFNFVGKQIQDVIHDYERRLCGKTERLSEDRLYRRKMNSCACHSRVSSKCFSLIFF